MFLEDGGHQGSLNFRYSEIDSGGQININFKSRVVN